MRAKSFLASISLVSMTLQPLAQAKEQANWSAQALKEYVKTTRNEKGQTDSFGKYWEKNYQNLPVEWQKTLKPSVEVLKNEKVPQMEVINIKGPQGKDSARLVMTIDGKTLTFEYIGQKDKFVRINGIYLSSEDVQSPELMMSKLAADPVVQADSLKTEKKLLSRTLVPDYATWKGMSSQERAELMIQLSLVSESADRALRIKNKIKNESAQFNFVELLLEKAYAQAGQACIVAGYVSKFVKDGDRFVCSIRHGIDNFRKEAASRGINIQESSLQCPDGQYKCNIFLLGNSSCNQATRGRGTPFQKVTSSCHEGSPVNHPDPAIARKARADMARQILAAEGKENPGIFNDKNEVVDKENYDKYIAPIIKRFDEFKGEALAKACGASSVKTNMRWDPEQQSACDSLRARTLEYQIAVIAPQPNPPPVATAPAPADGPGTPCFTDDFKGDKSKDSPNGIRDANKKCIATSVPAPAAAGSVAGLTKEECDKQGGTYVIDDKTGEKVCRTRDAAVAPVAGGTTRKEPSFFDKYRTQIYAGIALLATFFGVKYISKSLSGNSGSSQPSTPPAPPPLPPTPPPVVPPVVPPIEGGSGVGGAPAGGQR